MRSRKKVKRSYKRNILAIILFLLFIIIEMKYFNLLPNSNFKYRIDNLPNNIYTYLKNNLRPSKDYNMIISTTSDLPINNNDNSLLVDDSSTYTPITEKKLKFAEVTTDYFDNTLFIGDSRFVGFSIYRKFEGAKYFCYQSASVFNVLDTEQDVEPYGSIKLTDLLTVHKFDKIYLSLGINSLGAGIENHAGHFKQVLDIIKTTQPQAIVYLVANMHVTDEIKDETSQVNNANINFVNKMIEAFADNRQTFYIDPNVIYDDENGNLIKELTSDNAHVYIRHYDRLLYFLITNALVEE